jgi:hypothetical protein
MTAQNASVETRERYRFTDGAARYAFEYGYDHDDVISALHSPHFKQAAPDGEFHSFEHYLRLDDRPVKVITRLDTRTANDGHVITAVFALDLSSVPG